MIYDGISDGKMKAGLYLMNCTHVCSFVATCIFSETMGEKEIIICAQIHNAVSAKIE